MAARRPAHLERRDFGAKAKFDAELAGMLGERYAKTIGIARLIRLKMKRAGDLAGDGREGRLEFYGVCPR